MTKKHYDKLTHKEHILKRCDMYIGSNKITTESKYIFKDEQIIKTDIDISSGLERIFLEILLNAADNVLNSRENDVKVGKIIVNVDNDSVSVYNEGLHISTSMSKKHKMRIPELIFFNLMSGSNLDDNNQRRTGGKFGMGSKLTAIFSKKFIVEIGDPKRHIYYKQSSENNMNIVYPAEMSSYDGTKGFTKITFYPDFSRFNIEEFSEDIINLFHYYSLSVSFTKNVKVIFNKHKYKLDIYSFSKLFGIESDNVMKIESDDSEVLLVDSPSNGDIISFVNSIPTIDGVHTKDWLNSIIKELGFDLRSTKSQFKQNIFMIINCLLIEPDFTSQSKTTLASPKPTININKKELKKMLKWQSIMNIKDDKRMKILSSNDGKKTKYVNTKKLSDAKFAGTKESMRCTLYLSEGDSSKGSILRIIGDRNYNGVFPLQGKILNSSKADDDRYVSNKEISSIKKILGIKEEIDYSDEDNIKKLRYGKVCIFADQDVDGQHIKGLLYLLFDKHYTSLIASNYVSSLETPLVKVIKGKKSHYFYNMNSFNEWCKDNDTKNIKLKYFKGIGSLLDEDLKYIFDNPKILQLRYDRKASDSLSLAFDNGRENDRKEWISNYIPSLKESKTISEFVNNDLITHSVENVQRTISSVVDGLKQSQRKILYTCIKKAKVKSYKVSDMKGLVSAETNYHYGDRCLEDTIFNMGKCYIGSNNIPLLKGEGNFGSRMGSDTAQARYPSVKLSNIVQYIFRQEDDIILEYVKDGDRDLEPNNYYPIIPMWLINGCSGIATGYNHYITPRNPYDVIKYIFKWLKNSDYDTELSPYYHNYNGKIFKENNRWYSKYKIRYEDDIYHIKEIPITITGSKCQEKLEKLASQNKIKSYKDLSYGITTSRCIDTQPYFIVDCDDIPFDSKVPIKKDNVNLLNFDKRCIQYDDIYEALKEYCDVRLKAYGIRKDKLLKLYDEQLKLEQLKIRYIKEIINGTLIITKKDDRVLISDMEDRGYPIEFLSMQQRSLTKNKVEEHMKIIETLERKISALESKSPKKLWREELKELRDKLE